MVRDNHHQSIQSAPIDLLDELKDRLEEMVRAYENHTAALQEKIDNLEEERRQLVKEVKTAHQLNIELQRRLESGQDSSTGVTKNYDHALRVIRDLLKDRPLAVEADEELNQTVINDLAALEDSETEESASTVRPRRTAPPTQASNPPFDIDLLQAHFGAEKLPGFVTETHCRSLKWNRWLRYLNIDVDTENAVESLALANDLDLRIHGTDEDLFFVYHPIFLEADGESCFIDWSSKEVNQRIQDYLMKRESDEKPLHVFVLPQNKSKWSYVGAHQIRVLETRDSSPIWARLSNSDRALIAHHISERCHYDENQVSEALDAGELEEVCLDVYPVEEEETNNLLGRLPEKKRQK